MELKDWIKAARTHAGLTQEDFGSQLNLSKANISGWENGRHEPSFRQVVMVAGLTNFPVDELWGDAFEPKGPSLAEAAFANRAPSGRVLVEQLVALAKPHRPTLRKNLAALLAELLDRPDDPELVEQTIRDIERFYG